MIKKGLSPHKPLLTDRSQTTLTPLKGVKKVARGQEGSLFTKDEVVVTDRAQGS